MTQREQSCSWICLSIGPILAAVDNFVLDFRAEGVSPYSGCAPELRGATVAWSSFRLGGLMATFILYRVASEYSFGLVTSTISS